MFFFQDAVSPAAGANSAAAAMQQMGVGQFLRHEDPLGWVVVITLCVMSVSSWYFIIANAIRNSMVRSRADRVIDGFWANSSTQDAIRELEAQPKSEPFSKIALDAASAVAHHQQASAAAAGGRLAESLSRSEFIDRALRQAVDRESLRLEGGMTLLATVGSAAPFVGLLGTVWGIYHALIRISASGNASMEAVAGPVGEALIMTAFGLFAAIPAVFAYNFFSRANRLTYARFDEFAHDLHDFFATGSRVESK
ncbi:MULTISPECIES: MotA/TolQ/ExbB proton channel family protein [Rhodanobacter]|jgi:biopolymer transport protein ExbB|uniref:Biopolymer transport protein ExbB n=1 Tax=Rhodanobacter glycinis TaxID=582702 RepID=A0A1I4GDK4_9GAMM|nr:MULTISPECIES: MotA/TolQ/ExbB proton channel family protein [Rhodanobacter]TAM20833.1 MAG: MotA/TolQ/ExbB proton channel family protein [Rhodanobacter sp.]SFL28128.1 outer membrane transport energization protein ExbB [Rhodanobacter glycinis]